MNTAEARRTIAAYLTGARIARDAVEEACGTLNRSDPDYVRCVRREFGLSGGDASGCVRFRARLAEFRQLDAEQARAEMPELVAHRAVCAACWDAYWSLRPSWVAAAPPAVRQQVLEDALCVQIAARGVRALGRGVPPTPVASVAAAADECKAPGGAAGDSPVRQWQQWDLSDPSAKTTVRVAVHHAPGNRVSVRVELRGGTAAEGPPVKASIEIWDMRRNQSFGGGPLSSFAKGLVLPPGSWLLRVQLDAVEGERGWSIPLDIQTEECDERW
jgi:hypothetical protein